MTALGEHAVGPKHPEGTSPTQIYKPIWESLDLYPTARRVLSWGKEEAAFWVAGPKDGSWMCSPGAAGVG